MIKIIKEALQMATIHKKVHYGKTKKLPLILIFFYYVYKNIFHKKIVIKDNKKDIIKGYISYSIKNLKGKRIANIDFIMVSKEYQGEGVGSRLIEEMKKNEKIITVKFDVNNTPLKKFYLKNGFKKKRFLFYEGVLKYEEWVWIKDRANN